jgi:hypothetical protein
MAIGASLRDLKSSLMALRSGTECLDEYFARRSSRCVRLKLQAKRSSNVVIFKRSGH